MEKNKTGRVAALGGVFIHAKKPAELAEWYENTLGLNFSKASDTVYYTDFKYQLPGNPSHEYYTVFSIMGKQVEIPKQSTYTLNLRVDDLEKLIQKLNTNQVEVKGIEIHAEGKFAWIHDPEGNHIELWEDTLA